MLLDELRDLRMADLCALHLWKARLVSNISEFDLRVIDFLLPHRNTYPSSFFGAALNFTPLRRMATATTHCRFYWFWLL